MVDNLSIPKLYEYFLRNPSIQTDTRNIIPGDIFFALRGPHFNGNHFARTALEAGASFVVVDELEWAPAERTFLVKDALKTLQELASYHRHQFDIPFLAITGSNGKTTTKELIRKVLSESYTTYATEGNLNNHIGIPLTLLRVKQGTEMVIIEMGANHQQEIAGYCQIVNPTHGCITNIGKAHLEGFGGLEGVIKGKGELFDHLRKVSGTIFICPQLPYLQDMARGIAHQITYGSQDTSVLGRIRQQIPFLEIIINDPEIGFLKTNLTGDYNYFNVMAAVAIGKYFNIPGQKLKQAIEGYIPQNNRSQIIHSGSNTFLLDAYNANPSSMEAAIENFAKGGTDQKILLLGAMMELGSASLDEHSRLVDLIQSLDFQDVVLVGGDFARVEHPYIYFPNVLEAKKWWQSRHFEQVQVLIKGSRSISMEKIIDP
ncbi:MAG: UDP-N-acetylmuramoyl-tripeptide--D-alanyl-D-alanine ligase [Chitinophagaceae bacterium]